MKKIVSLFIVSALAFVACDKIENTDPSVGNEPDVLSFEADILTAKTTFSSNKTLWNHDDEITVYNGTAASNFTNNLESGTSASVTYSGTLASAAEYWAMYPVPASNVYGFTSGEWDATRSWTATGPVYTVPASQTAVTDGIQEGLDVIVASTTTTSMSFTHACAALKFTIGPSSPAITEITVEGAKIAGNYRYVMSSGSQESFSGSSGAITLSMGGTVFPIGDYYIMIAVRNYPSGLSFTFKRSDGKIASVTKSTALTPTAGKVYPMGTIPAGLSFNTVLATAPSVGDSCEGGICGYVNATYKYALVIGLSEETKYWAEGNTWIGTLGEGWYMPSLDEFKDLRTGILDAGTFDAFNSIITGTLSGTALQKTTYYWTSTVKPGDDTQVEYYKFYNSAGTAADYGYAKKTGKERPVRAIKKVFFE